MRPTLRLLCACFLKRNQLPLPAHHAPLFYDMLALLAPIGSGPIGYIKLGGDVPGPLMGWGGCGDHLGGCEYTPRVSRERPKRGVLPWVVPYGSQTCPGHYSGPLCRILAILGSMYIRRRRLTKIALKPAIFQVGVPEIFRFQVGPKGDRKSVV